MLYRHDFRRRLMMKKIEKNKTNNATLDIYSLRTRKGSHLGNV